LKFLSKISRDLVLLTLRCFAAKNYLLNSKILTELNFSQGEIFNNSNKKLAKKQFFSDILLEIA